MKVVLDLGSHTIAIDEHEFGEALSVAMLFARHVFELHQL
jgi:hypothetical protein